MADRTTPPVALVTGATRGIGRGVALALGRLGHTVVITGRTLAEGTAVNPATGHALPGSLRTTAAEIEAAGGACVPLVNDVLDLERAAPLVDEIVERCGRLDVLVNNAVYVGPGNDCVFTENDPDDVVRRVTGNLTAPLLLTHAFLRHALARDVHPTLGARAWLIDVTSDAGRRTPERLAGQGGWSLVYAATKGGFHRIADMVAHEYGHHGVRAVNVNPGLVATERVLDSGPGLAWIAERGATPEAIGEAIVRVARDPVVGNGAYVHVQDYLNESS
jgi:NAD(P)-dependent dehydrogenase (short-subunit alcohol dehydrogenase family)